MRTHATFRVFAWSFGHTSAHLRFNRTRSTSDTHHPVFQNRVSHGDRGERPAGHLRQGQGKDPRETQAPENQPNAGYRQP